MAFSVSPVLTGQLFNNQGKPLAGGKVFSYVGGSFSTLQSTYTTDAGTTANPNPLTLDASGRVPPMFLDADLLYNIALTASDGTTVIQTFQNVQGAITQQVLTDELDNLNFLSASGGTITGTLEVTGGTVLRGTQVTTLNASGTSTLQAVNAASVTAALNGAGQRLQNIATPTAGTDAATKGYVDSAIPAGVVSYTAGSAAPAGWLLCNGQSVSRTTYAPLFSAIGTTYGSVDVNTFNVPDLRGYFIRALDLGRGVDVDRTLGSYQADEFASHSHAGVPQLLADNDRGAGSSSFSIDTTGSTSPTGGTETRPKNLALVAIIKT
jgi:microcystin-dependent protein